jgi:hypothetical protein
LSHPTSPFCDEFFQDRVLWTTLPRAASNHNPPDLYLPSSWEYRRESLVPGSFHILLISLHQCSSAINTWLSSLLRKFFLFSSPPMKW